VEVAGVLNVPQAAGGSFLSAETSFQPYLLQQHRSFSSYNRVQGAYPQYHVYGEKAMLAVKVIMPTFKRVIKGESIAVDRAGRLLLEFIARSPADGSFLWDNRVAFALSAEEVGLFCSQLPQNSIELSRQRTSDGAVEYPDKVLKIVPRPGAAVSFSVDYLKDGVPGQPPGPGQDGGEVCVF
jgi:hypothetical protein